MKLAIGLIVSAFSTLAIACPQEAQIIATITSATSNGPTTCTAFVDASTTRFYADNGCGLSFADVVSEGVQFRRHAGVSCDSAKESELNGIVKRSSDGRLILEQN